MEHRQLISRKKMEHRQLISRNSAHLFLFYSAQIPLIPVKKCKGFERILLNCSLKFPLIPRLGIAKLFKSISNIQKSKQEIYKSIMFQVNKPGEYLKNSRLMKEAKTRGDVIIVNMSPNYHMLTVQLLIGYMWVHYSCPRVDYILKVC